MTDKAHIDDGSHSTAPSDSKMKDQLEAYRLVFDVWKLQNENYFKRIQFLMVVIQSGLIIAIAQFLSKPISSCSWENVVVPGVLSFFGLLSTVLWKKLNERQNQYGEFCRRILRNLEKMLWDLDIPLHYFTAESFVFGPYRNNPPKIPGVKIECADSCGKKLNVIKFEKSGEEYPETKENKKNIHQLGRAHGGMIFFENKVACGFFYFWIFVFLTFLSIGIWKWSQGKLLHPCFDNIIRDSFPTVITSCSKSLSA
jgi:hypothetical protein